MLEREVNTDLLYQVQKELRGYSIYSDADIEAFAGEYFSYGRQDSRSMGRMTSILKPVADRYNKLTPDERYQFRRLCRNMIKWYGYISQVVRMFDTDLHKEYVFLSYLLGLIPPETTTMIDLEGKLQLEYYKLQKTFEGAIMLKEETGVYTPASAKGAVKPEEKQPLDEIIEKMQASRKIGKQNFIIIVAEGVGHSEEIAKTIQAKTGIESRATILGHVQRGGSPTVRDRVLASRMGNYAVELLEKGIGNRVVGVRGNTLVDYDIQEALKMVKPFDDDLYDLTKVISI